MELQKLSEQIMAKIEELEGLKHGLLSAAEDKARTAADYDQAMAATILLIRAESELPANLVEKVAKGRCFQAMLASGMAEGRYKAIISNMSATEAQLNGLQSLNRYQSEV